MTKESHFFHQVNHPSLQKDLFTLEKQERAMNLKFGVIYAQKGQWTDDEFFSNQETSESFENFLNLLGEKITLKNWDRYRGGLDVHNNMTGSESVYTLFEDHQIMFHVSTLLPYTQEDTQQVRFPTYVKWRKRQTVRRRIVFPYAFLTVAKSTSSHLAKT